MGQPCTNEHPPQHSSIWFVCCAQACPSQGSFAAHVILHRSHYYHEMSLDGRRGKVVIQQKAITANYAAVGTAHVAYLHSVQNRRSFRRLVKYLVRAYRERQEKAENKARAAAETNWRNLLRSIFTRIKVQGDYADDADNGSGEPKCSYSLQCQTHG